MNDTLTISEADIIAEVIAPNEGDLPADVARSVLKWKFGDKAARRMSMLADRNNKGIITDPEREELERYLRVGSVINIVQAKARVSLKNSGSPG